MAVCHSTIAAEALHFRVRDGNGCFLLAMITGKNFTQTLRFEKIKIETDTEFNTPRGKTKIMIKPHGRLVLVS
jgi:hypothetical protein